MKKLKKSKWLTGTLLAAAIVMTVFSGVQGSRAALSYISDNYVASMNLTVLPSVAIVENGVSSGNLLNSLPLSNKDFKTGKVYPEKLLIQNDGELDEYVRVVLRKYWSYSDGTKCQGLDPALVELNMDGSEWLVDESASTDERLVLFWPEILKAGESTGLMCTELKLVDNESTTQIVKTRTVTTEDGYTTYTTYSPYNGCYFTIEVEAYGVQTHNAADAIKSAWGATVTVADDGTIALG